MSQIKVLAYFNKKKCQFSLEALEGDNQGRVIAHESEIILTDCKFSKNKDKTAGIIGFWNSMKTSSLHVDKEIRRHFGTEDEKDDGWSPIYATEHIKYDFDLKQYIVDDDMDLGCISGETINQIQSDKQLIKTALDNAGVIYLEIDADAFDAANSPRQYDFEETPDIRDFFDSDTIKGFACYWRKKKTRN